MTDLIRMVGIAGSVKGSSERGVLEQYGSDCSFVKPVMPAYVAKPRDVEEVEKLVKSANETRTPLVPVSSGPPHFRGDTVPAEGGAVVVDLSDMNRILRIDRLNRVAMIEPGVRFEELQAEVKEVGHETKHPLVTEKNEVRSGESA